MIWLDGIVMAIVVVTRCMAARSMAGRITTINTSADADYKVTMGGIIFVATGLLRQ